MLHPPRLARNTVDMIFVWSALPVCYQHQHGPQVALISKFDWEPHRVDCLLSRKKRKYYKKGYLTRKTKMRFRTRIISLHTSHCDHIK
jgi:hypothetical protein